MMNSKAQQSNGIGAGLQKIRAKHTDEEILRTLIDHNYFSDFDWKEIAEHIFKIGDDS